MSGPQQDLVKQLRRQHDGEPWHGPSRATVLEGITADEAAWRPAADAHSIWDLVLHMRSWTLEVLRRANGGAPGEPEDGDWPAPPRKPTADEWQKALRSLDDAHAALIAAVGAMPADRLSARVGDTSTPDESRISVAAMVRSLAEHDIYHTGQVAMLKRLARSMR